MSNFYDVLGVEPGVPQAAIRLAYRRQAKSHHPDTAGTGAAARMVLLNQAYDVLKDPAARKAYDAGLKAAHSLPRRPTGGPAVVIVDPILFIVKVFNPLDAQLMRAVRRLDKALLDLAYDIYDDVHLAAFTLILRQIRFEVTEADVTLRSNPWPDGMISGLNLYGQGLRQVEDALEDFETFLLNFDSDLLVQGRMILKGGLELLVDARFFVK